MLNEEKTPVNNEKEPEAFYVCLTGTQNKGRSAREKCTCVLSVVKLLKMLIHALIL